MKISKKRYKIVSFTRFELELVNFGNHHIEFVINRLLNENNIPVFRKKQIFPLIHRGNINIIDYIGIKYGELSYWYNDGSMKIYFKWAYNMDDYIKHNDKKPKKEPENISPFPSSSSSSSSSSEKVVTWKEKDWEVEFQQPEEESIDSKRAKFKEKQKQKIAAKPKRK